MQALKQSTTATLIIGPVLGIDGAPYTTDDLAYTDFKITKAGTVGNLNAGATVAHSHQGHFLVSLTTSDTDTLGTLTLTLNKASLAMSPRAVMICGANVWDSLYSTDKLQVDAIEIGGQTATAAAGITIGAFVGNATAAITVNGSGYVTYANTAPLDAAGVRTAVGLAAANLDTQLGDIPTVAEFEARTLVAASYGTAANQTTIAGYIDTEVAAIKAVTDKLDTALELDGAVYRYTTNALEQSPVGTGGFTSGDRANLEAIEAKLPTADYLAAGADASGAVSVTFTQTGAQISAALSGTAWTIHRGDSIDQDFTCQAFTGWTQLILSLKTDLQDADSASQLRVMLSNPPGGSDGLVYIAGAAGTKANASLTVISAAAGTLTLWVAAAEVAKLSAGKNRRYDVQYKDSAGDVHTIASGLASVNADVTQSV